jgi:transposase
MRRAAKIIREASVEELKSREREVKDVRERKRLMGIRLKVEGYSVPEIMRIIPVSQSGLLTWVNNFNEKGFDGLVSKKPPGKRRFLNEEQIVVLREWIKEGPEEQHGCFFWTGNKLIEAVEKEFGVKYSLNGMYDLLKDLGYSRQVTKAQHHKSDPEKAEEFKKNSPQWLRR